MYFKFQLSACFILVILIRTYAQESIGLERNVHFQRSSVLVSNLNESLKVYRDILGFEVAIIAESDKDSYVYEVFNIPKEANVKVATLHSSDQKRIINLKQVTGVNLPRMRDGIIMSAVLIRVEDLRTVMEMIDTMGLKHTKEHEVRGKRISYKEQSFIDPDGHLVALYELLK